ncbi:MAG: pyridoxamine 5'-phosphate oxidase [Acidimicrobiales bacterium]
MSERWIPLEVDECDANPFVQFRRWFDEALGEVREREAVALVTATRDARPSARMVLLRHVDETSLGWFTNYESRKARELDENPHAAILWYCEPLGRQIRVEGVVTTMTRAASDRYFASRPRGHQIGAHASHQSEPLASRGELEERVAELTAHYEGLEIERPENWGGYVLVPSTWEFWQHRQDRLHDRVLYRLEAGQWRRQRLYP